jgi:hypothetical protein
MTGRIFARLADNRLRAGFSAAVHFVSFLELNLESFRRDFDPRADKKKADQPKLTRPFRLEASDVGCLQTLGAAGNFEFNRLAFVQRLVTFRLNGRKVDENVLAGLALDEPKTLAGIKPLHCSLFSH